MQYTQTLLLISSISSEAQNDDE